MPSSSDPIAQRTDLEQRTAGELSLSRSVLACLSRRVSKHRNFCAEPPGTSVTPAPSSKDVSPTAQAGQIDVLPKFCGKLKIEMTEINQIRGGLSRAIRFVSYTKPS